MDLIDANKLLDDIKHTDLEFMSQSDVIECLEDIIKRQEMKEGTELDRIEKLQYANLRGCFYNILLYPILGDNYYNMAMDVYESDSESCKDIRRKYEYMVQSRENYKGLFIAALVMIVILSAVIIFK